MIWTPKGTVLKMAIAARETQEANEFIMISEESQ